MTTIGNDFVSPALTRGFQAKGGQGLALAADLLPVVTGHELERGPWPPFIPWFWGGVVAAVATDYAIAQLAMLANSNQDARLVIDELFVYNAESVVRMGIVLGTLSYVSINPVLGTDLTREQDTGTSGAQFAQELGELSAGIATSATDPLATAAATWKIVNVSNAYQRGFMRMHMIMKPNQTLVIASTAINQVLYVHARGRIFR